jgi:hypothetical protein
MVISLKKKKWKNQIFIKEDRLNELTISNELKGLDKSKAKQIEAVFAPMVKMLKEFEAVYDEIAALEINPVTCKKAKRLRLDIAKVRIDADKVRKDQKEEYLRAGNAIQGVYNILKFAVVDKEEKLKDIETHYEQIEVEKKKQLQQDRETELQKYNVDGSTMALSNMDDIVWNNFLSGIKTNHEAIILAEEKAERDLIEKQKKDKIYSERQTDLIPYAQFGALDLLTLDTTAEQYDKIVIAMKAEKTAHDEEQAGIKAENERLKKEKDRLEQESLKRAKEEIERKAADIAKTAEEEAAKKEIARVEKEQAAKKAEEEEKDRLAPDKEKLKIIGNYLLEKLETVLSGEAKDALKQAHYIIVNAAGEM